MIRFPDRFVKGLRYRERTKRKPLPHMRKPLVYSIMEKPVPIHNLPPAILLFYQLIEWQGEGAPRQAGQSNESSFARIKAGSPGGVFEKTSGTGTGFPVPCH
jgi:hypothetical protein